MEFNFEEDTVKWCVNTINRLGFTPVSKDETHKLLSQIFTITNNLIAPTPRIIKVANGFSCPEKHTKGYQQILSEVKRGIDLSPRGSRKQKTGNTHIDEMLIDWGVHHLHLGTKKISSGKNKGLIEGHKEILFVKFTAEYAYIIGIFDHSSWDKTEVLTIIKDNWEHLLEPFRLNRVIDVTPKVTENIRGKYRKSRINTPIQIRDSFYFGPGGGFTAGGFGYNEVERAMSVLRSIRELTLWVNENIEFLTEKILPYQHGANNEIIQFEVSKYILTRTFTIQTCYSALRLHLPCNSEPASLIHPSLAHVIEPDEEKYAFWRILDINSVLIEKNTFDIG